MLDNSLKDNYIGRRTERIGPGRRAKMPYNFTLKAARQRATLSQRQIGDLLGVTTKTVQNWENNSVRIRPVYLKAWANICGVSVDDIFLPSELSKSEP